MVCFSIVMLVFRAMTLYDTPKSQWLLHTYKNGWFVKVLFLLVHVCISGVFFGMKDIDINASINCIRIHAFWETCFGQIGTEGRHHYD